MTGLRAERGAWHVAGAHYVVAVVRTLVSLTRGHGVVQPAGASEEETRKCWSHQVGFLEEEGGRIWMGLGAGEADGRAWAEVGRQGCQWDQGQTCKVGSFVERTMRVPNGQYGVELSTCWALPGTPCQTRELGTLIALEEKSGFPGHQVSLLSCSMELGCFDFTVAVTVDSTVIVSEVLRH